MHRASFWECRELTGPFSSGFTCFGRDRRTADMAGNAANSVPWRAIGVRYCGASECPLSVKGGSRWRVLERSKMTPKRTFLVCATNLATLHRWAWNCPERAENAAIARKGLKSLSASLAVIKELASVHRHVFDPLMAALGTSDSGLFDHNCGSLVCTMASRICIASAVPSASPFSKSWAVCPIVLVTWAIHRTLAWRTLASV